MSQPRLFFRCAALAAVVLVAVAASNCGGGRPVTPSSDAGTSSISGLVFKGRVSGATVTAYAVTATGERGSPLASGVTDTSGAFTLSDVPSYNGPVLLVATGGSFPEEAVANATIQLESRELTYLIGNYASGSNPQGLSITPVSHLAAGLASYWVAAEEKPVAEASDEAWLRFNNHFGGSLGGALDWRTVSPADLTSSGNGQLNASGLAGLALAGLSMQARTIAEKAGLTPGAALSSLALVDALYQDLRADGFLDGQGPQGPLLLPAGGFVADAGPTATTLDGQVLRLALGQAIERFIRSDRNQSGLTLNDVLPFVQHLSSNSDARLFRSGGVDYDHEPPTVIFSATFSRDGATSHAPVGPSRLVGGTLTVTADVTDASTIQTVTLSVSGKPLTTTFTGSGAHRVVVGNFASTSDGPITVTAAVADVHGNTTSVTYGLTVDNTAPSITVATGSPSTSAWYSTSVPVDVSAADASGVTAFTLTGLPGFNNLSGVTGRIAGTWEVPSSQPNGPHSLQLSATDSALNVAVLPVTLKIDRTAPSLSLTTSIPPRYTSNSRITVRVTAADVGSGVTAVKGSINGAPEVTVSSPSNGVWEVPVELGLEGNKRILLWALDGALPTGNSSYATALVVDLTRDATNPAPVVQTNVGSYYDERPASVVNGTPSPGMSLQLDSSGNPIVPPVYTFPVGAAKRAVTGAGDVYKASTRLSWGRTVPTAQQLYAQDGSTMNVPFIAYDVPVTASQAPILPNARYTVTCSNCSSFPPAGGTLLHDASFNGDPQRFLLPLAIDNIPGLAQLQGPRQIQVDATFTDAAGNSATSTITLTFHVVGPPLTATVDATYATQQDPKSIFGYRAGAGRTYASLFDASNPNFTPTGVRAMRILVLNPAPHPVAFLPSLAGGSVAHSEAWNDVIRNASAGATTVAPAVPPIVRYATCESPRFSPPAPCGGFANSSANSLYQGYFPQSCTMPSAQPPAESSWQNPHTTAASATLSALTPYTVPDDSAAAVVPGTSGYVVIPPAVGTTPGKLALYVYRPASVSRTVPIQLIDVLTSAAQPLGPNAYSYTVEDFWYPSGAPYDCCIATSGEPTCNPTGSQDYALRRHARYLTSASTSATAIVTLTSHPVISGGSLLLGEPSVGVISQPFTANFIH